MGHGLNLKQIIYFNDRRLINEEFDYIYNYKGHLVAYNSNALFIINAKGEILVHKKGKIFQVFNYGECISIQTKHNTMCAYRYDGRLLIANCYSIYIVNNNILNIQKNENDPFLVVEL